MADDAIWIIDDDLDDHDLIRDLSKDLKIPNDLEFFTDADSFLKRMDAVRVAPFIILCDLNLVGISGFELRERMLKAAEKKLHSVPFIFWSSAASDSVISQAYRLRANGFFLKEPSYHQWKETLASILTYWKRCLMPSKKEGFDEPLPA